MRFTLSRCGMIVFLAGVAAPAIARAAKGDWFLDLNLGSWHSEKNYRWEGHVQRYNQRNLGLGASYQLKEWCDAKVGWFENSYEKISAYGLLNGHWEVARYGGWTFSPGVAGGIISGYQNTPEQTGAVAPWGMVTLTVASPGRWRVNLGYIPSRLFVTNSVEVATLQLSFKL